MRLDAERHSDDAFALGPRPINDRAERGVRVMMFAGKALQAGAELPQRADDVGFVPVLMRGWLFRFGDSMV